MKYFVFSNLRGEFNTADNYREYWIFEPKNKIRKWRHYANWFNLDNPHYKHMNGVAFHVSNYSVWKKNHQYKQKPIEVTYEEMVLDAI